MGVSGLLPLLKPIQNQRHLSDFSGKTVAVDAYVWLHKGAYGCAPELVTGKTTTKYVDYAMHRVRMLRHHGIEPYLVFDGGPLPAKKGTELDRHEKRAANLKKGNNLAAKDQHTKAREYYTKCIDITPQLAFQLIKALRAESVPYIVAPYEADAQMAYLERLHIVDAILTEDSDLLVFGCQNVLYKFDVASATVIHICRSDFAAASPDFVGWSDREFRLMAILSGCDYLPSISGIGLKTAQKLVKKHKTVEKALKALRLEGKRDVPKMYLEQFKMAETVFLYQRVYDPVLQKLVHLNDGLPSEELGEAAQVYVGGDLDPSLAKTIAQGNVCPISLEPMEDVNPSYRPSKPLTRAKTIPLYPTTSTNCQHPVLKGKETTGLLRFFGQKPRPSEPLSVRSLSQPVLSSMAPPLIAGRTSGKRTLAEVMQEDMTTKRQKVDRSDTRRAHASEFIRSRFFNTQRTTTDGASPSGTMPNVIDLTEENHSDSENGVMDIEEEEPVVQEDGYLSPTPSLARLATPELSSPGRQRGLQESPINISPEHVTLEADCIFTPTILRISSKACRYTSPSPPALPKHRAGDGGLLLVRDTPSPDDEQEPGGSQLHTLDLRGVFQDDASSDILDPVEQNHRGEGANSLNITRVKVSNNEEVTEGDDLSEWEDELVGQQAQRHQQSVVARGWWSKYAQFSGHQKNSRKSIARTPLKRRDAINRVAVDDDPDDPGLASSEVSMRNISRRKENMRQLAPSRLLFERTS